MYKIYLFIFIYFVFIYLFIYLLSIIFIYLFIYLFMYLCIYLSTVYLFFILSFICLCIYLNLICWFIHSFILFIYIWNLYHANILFKDSFVSIPIVSIVAHFALFVLHYLNLIQNSNIIK